MDWLIKVISNYLSKKNEGSETNNGARKTLISIIAKHFVLVSWDEKDLKDRSFWELRLLLSLRIIYGNGYP
jgi:hypothetical protein